MRGAANYAGELGHLPVLPDGPPCTCGQRGCLETLASGGGILERVRDQLPAWPASALAQAKTTLTAADVFKAADSGDTLALSIIEDAVLALSAALIGLVNLLNPGLVVYGGGTLADGWLMGRVRPQVEQRLLPAARRALSGILPSPLHPDQVGLLGAACLAWNLVETG